MLSKLRRALGAVAGLLAIVVASSLVHAQSLANASFESPAVNANTDSLRPTGATWAFTGHPAFATTAHPMAV